LARSLRKAGFEPAAQESWAELAHYYNVWLDGVPADLVAARAAGRSDIVAAGLVGGKWAIDHATFTRYAAELGLSADPKRVALSASAEWVLSQREVEKPRLAKEFEGVRMVILSNGSSSLIAGPDFQAGWLAGLDASRIAIGGARPSNAVIRTAA